MRPDDITDEEIDAYGQEHAQPIDALAAMNALRDRRVRSVVIGEIAQAVETMPGVCEFDAENVAGRVRAMNDTGDHT